jgi:hypothetical protein
MLLRSNSSIAPHFPCSVISLRRFPPPSFGAKLIPQYHACCQDGHKLVGMTSSNLVDEIWNTDGRPAPILGTSWDKFASVSVDVRARNEPE